MNLIKKSLNFQKKNIAWVIGYIIIIFIYFPLEMLVFGYLFGKIFSKIGDIKKNLTLIIILIGIIIGAYFFLEITGYLKERFDAYYFKMMNHDIRLQIIDLIYNKLSINYESINNGEFIGRLLKIPNILSYFFERFNRIVLPMIISIISVCLFFLFNNFKFGILVLILFLINFIIYFIISKKIINKSKLKEFNENKLIDEIDDSLHNSFSTITTGNINQERNRIEHKHSKFDNIFNDEMSVIASIKFILGILNIIFFILLSLFIIYQYKKNLISKSLSITFIIVLIFLIKQIRNQILGTIEMFTYYGNIKENNKFLSSLISDIIIDGHIDNLDLIGKIEFKNVTFHYKDSSQKALDNVSFTVNPRENIAIIGKNASGKTTIIKLILGFYKASEGEILIDGVSVNNIKKEYLRNKISIVHQNVKLFNRTVLENIAYGTKYSLAEIKEKLKKLRVIEVFTNLPDGLNTMAGKYGDKLSGGQKQIIYMLRCYFRENPIILLDEPTAAVDQYHKNFVLEMIKELCKNSTCIIVTHDPSIYNLYKKKFIIENGILKSFDK
jgi:ABC-type multidrug transport system fused ATPase/permease subunit